MSKHSSHCELYVHLVWATRDRMPVITPTLTTVLRHYIGKRLPPIGCQLLALGCVEDHLHAAIRTHPSISVAKLVHDIKGSSSHHINHCDQGFARLNWQSGYGAFSFWGKDAHVVLDYVNSQVQRHAHGEVIPEWERCEEDDVFDGFANSSTRRLRSGALRIGGSGDDG